MKRSTRAPEADDSLEELDELARSAGAEITGRVLQVRDAPDSATLFGRGKAEEIKRLSQDLKANLIVVDHDLTPTQQRNLEKLLELKVIDRTQLILDIFASRARTREGRLQVELAQLNYLLPRLSGQGVAMSRLGGGIGTRGPGETKLETDRRRIKARIKKIEASIDKVRAGRTIHRRQREAVPLQTVALVGYTNAGKSTLFNRLTRADVLADHKMFATLDPTVRLLPVPSKRKVLLSDTVGFIRHLPTTLVHAFRATLEEITDAELILHVVDISNEQASAQTAQVLEVLAEIGVTDRPQILALNKCDRLTHEARNVEALRRSALRGLPADPGIQAALISGLSGEGLPQLLELVDRSLPAFGVTVERFRIPAGDGAGISLLHEAGNVLNVQYHGDVCEMEAAVPESVRDRLAQYLSTPAVEKLVQKSP